MRMGHRKLQPPPCLGRASSAGCPPRSAPAALCCHSTGQTAYRQRHTCQRTLLSTSSSGQDVALWPREPRFKSWSGHLCQAQLPSAWVFPTFCPLKLRTAAPITRLFSHSACPSLATVRRKAVIHGSLCQQEINSSGIARSGSTSSSGQDVASWPRQPRFKSWCGHLCQAQLPSAWVLLAACPLKL